ncbi:MAG: vWA domain-containing protein [Gemmataceae bacterium]
MRRYALPLTLSALAHLAVVILVVVLAVSMPSSEKSGVRAAGTGSLTLALAGPQRRPAAPPRKLDPDEWNVDLEPPRLVIPAAPAVPDTPGSGGPIQPVGHATPAGPGPGTTEPGGTSGPGMGPVGSTLLPVSRQAQRIVYLLDRSISMGPGGGLDRARAEVALSLRALPPGARFQILAYNRSVVPLVPHPAGLVPADTPHLAQALTALEELSATGATHHAAALRQGLALRPEVLFLLTDADDLDDREAAALIRAYPAGTVLHVVELARGLAGRPGALARLAAHTQGSYRQVPLRR